MKPTRLNLSLLRRGTEGSGNADAALSRRRWLGMTGSAAVVALPTLRSIDAMLFGPFEVKRTSRRLAFVVNGEERWVIDADRFAGSPRLDVEQDRHRVVANLRSARFPGTPIPADFTAEITEGLFGWNIAVDFTSIGFRTSGRFVPWLYRTEELTGAVTIPHSPFRIGPGHQLQFSSNARCAFTPDWTLRMTGDGVATVTGLGAPVVADKCLLQLHDDASEPIERSMRDRRCSFVLERGDRVWEFAPAGFEKGGWAFSSTGSPFDRIRFDAAEGRDGRRQFAMLAEGSPERAVLSAHPRGSLTHSDGRRFGLPLREVRYAFASNRGREQAAVTGRFGIDPVWLVAGSAGVQVGDGPEAAPFELIRDGFDLQSVRCAPAVLQTAVPLPDAIVEPIAISGITHLDLSGTQQIQKAPQIQQKSASKVQLKLPSNLEAAVKLKFVDLAVSVIRPEDMLKIDFEFRNLTLTKSGAVTQLVRTTSGASAHIIVRFPPQHIAEQAFFESADTGSGSKSLLTKMRQSSPETPTIPAKSRISGPSRLVFIVPPSVQSLDYTLEALLTACTEYPVSVTAAGSMMSEDQKKLLTSLTKTVLRPSAVASMALSSATTAGGTVKGLAGKSTMEAKSALQKDVSSLQTSRAQIRQLPEIYRPQRKSEKRIETLQNAIARSAKYDPTSAAKYAGTLERLTAQWQKSDADAAFDLGFMGAHPFAILRPTPAEPTDEQTSIEAPYRLILSPHPYAAWAHAAKAVKVNGRYELWHTRLGVRGIGRVNENFPRLRTVRAVWSPDAGKTPADGPKHVEGGPPNDDGNPFRLSVDRQDKHEIVHLTSNFAIPAPYEPLPVNVNQLFLTSLGSWLNLRGAWEPPQYLSVQSWQHRATMGRDHYVRLVYAGYLFPFGHRVSLIKVTERKFQRYGDQMAAFLRQRMFIIVREPVKTYPGPGQDNATSGTKDARAFPFRSVHVTTLITPNLDSPAQSDINDMGQGCFWPRVGDKDFEFHMVGEDWDGNQIHFAAPVIYVDKGAMDDATLTGLFGKPEKNIFWNYLSNMDRRRVDFHGQRIAYADSQNPGDTTFETDNILFGVDRNWNERTQLSLDYLPSFYPTVARASVRIMAVEQLVGSQARQEIEFVDAFRKSGFDAGANAGSVFAKLVTEVGVDFSKDTSKAGAFLAPNMNISALSRSVGAVGGTVDKIVNGEFDPEDFFKGMLDKVKIFGCIPLTAILEKINDFSNMLEKIPKFVNENTPDMLDTTYEWKPRLGKITSGPLKGVFVPNNPDGGLSVKVHAHMALDGSAPSMEVVAKLSQFDLHLIPEIVECVIVKFDSMSISMVAGEKLDLDVKLNKVDFAGPLSFVNTLRDYIPLGGFSDPPGIDVSTSGIKAYYSIALPSIAVGMFSLQNLSLGAGLEIPFIGNPISAKFNFCERDNPFLLTVSIFGGGGFFNIVITPSGIALMEASFEFGGALALNLGVASGGVYVMAGIYYKKAGDVTSLEGYFRCGGSLEVLGIITVSVEFYMGLTYQSNGKVFGQAEVTVEVEVLFFSTSVTLHTERQFKGSASDPLIIDLYPTVDVYKQYLSAFAA